MTDEVHPKSREFCGGNSMTINRKSSIVPTVFLLSIGLLTLFTLLEGESPARNPRATRARSVTLRLTNPKGGWIKATETEGGLAVLQRDSTVLTLSPRIVSDQRVIVALRLVSSTCEGTKVFEDSIQIDNRIVTSAPKELIRAGLPFDFTVEAIAVASVHSSATANDLKDGSCCVVCEDVRTCACAVEATCGSCCTGSCCGPDSL